MKTSISFLHKNPCQKNLSRVYFNGQGGNKDWLITDSERIDTLAILSPFSHQAALKAKGDRTMPIIRSIKRKHLRDPRISWKAKGLLELLHALPEDQRSTTALSQFSKEGKQAIQSGINELIKFGYISTLEEE